MKFNPFHELFEIPLRNGLTKPKKVRGDGCKMVNMGELFAYSRIYNVEMDRVPINETEKSNSILQSGDLLFARQSLVREGAGQCSIFLGDDEEVCFESHLIRCRLKKDTCNPLFFYYYFKSHLGWVAIDAIVEQGAGASGIRGSDLANILVPDIDISTQDTIAAQLDSLDRKIAINTQINQTLERIAQALFKSWFVDFDPVKAKIAALESGGTKEEEALAAMTAISGKDENALAAFKTANPAAYAELEQTAALFPAAMQDSELGIIPVGWEVSEVGKEVTVAGGGTPSTKRKEFWDDGDIHWTTPKDLSNLDDKILIDTERKITKEGLKNISSGLLPIDTVLMSSRAPVGYLAIAKVNVAINQGYIAMRCVNKLPYTYVLQWCTQNMEEIKQRASGTTFAEISKSNFKPMKVIVPSTGILNIYAIQTANIYKKIEAGVRENHRLTDIRDALLPKLLSGEIDTERLGA